MRRSFRFQLALQFAGAMGAGLMIVGLLSFLAVRETLDREIEATLLGVASIQAGAATEADEGHMRLVEWELTADEAEALRDLNRFSQIWGEDGRSLLRTRYVTEDLPLDTAALRRAVVGELVWEEQEFQGRPVLSLYYPLGRFGEDHEAHVLQVSAPLESRDRLLGGVALFVSLAVVAISLASFGGAWWLADRTLGPVRRVTEQAEEIGGGTLGRRITAHADTEEYERLVRVLNGMLIRIDQAFEAQKRFTADASHELRSPMTVLRGEIEVALRRDRSPDEYRRVLSSNLEEVERLSRTAEDLLTLARSDAGVMEPRLRVVDLGERVGGVVERLRKLSEGKGLRLSADLDPGGRRVAGPVPGPDRESALSRRYGLTEDSGHLVTATCASNGLCGARAWGVPLRRTETSALVPVPGVRMLGVGPTRHVAHHGADRGIKAHHTRARPVLVSPHHSVHHAGRAFRTVHAVHHPAHSGPHALLKGLALFGSQDLMNGRHRFHHLGAPAHLVFSDGLEPGDLLGAELQLVGVLQQDLGTHHPPARHRALFHHLVRHHARSRGLVPVAVARMSLGHQGHGSDCGK